MKNYIEIQQYFDSLSNEELLQYYNEIKTIETSTDYIKVIEVLTSCYDTIDSIPLQINKLHWHLVETLIKRIK